MLEDYLNIVHGEAYERANDPEAGGLRLHALTVVLLDHLEEAGVVTGGQSAYYRHERGNVAAEVHAYAYDSDEDIISLFYCVDGNPDTPLGAPEAPGKVGKPEIDRAFRRLESFVRTARAGKITDVDESQPAAELIDLIRDRRRDVEFHVVATGTVSEKAVRIGKEDELNREVWDLLRLARTCGADGHGRVSIDFADEFGEPLPCLVMPEAEDGIQVLMTSVPGNVLAEIYNKYRARLLERNVRSFLQFTGKVNKGIRDTLLNAPGRFLPYNNGLAATAAEVELDELADGLARVRAVHDFQIVNGGQTTASVASCARRDGADLSHVSVAMKLTLVPRDRVDQLVPLISKYANTQNRIQEADFSANHPWHIKLEQLSRSTWARATKDAPRGTRWYYERSRGQYRDEQATHGTPAGRRRFRAENPSSQKLTKTDVAKYLLSWDQRPDIVSRGAQKCFMWFMAQLSNQNRRGPDAAEFRRIVALAILFRTAERLYGQLDFTGYRANVVTYSVARLSHALQRRLPWESIWNAQELPEELVSSLKTILRGVRAAIISPPNNRNITEWCKREQCWSKILTLPLELRLPEAQGEAAAPVGTASSPTEDQLALIETVRKVPPDVWFAASAWAKETASLQPWQRGLSYSMGSLLSRGKSPSPKQAVQGTKLLLEARRLGFAHDQMPDDVVRSLTGNEA